MAPTTYDEPITLPGVDEATLPMRGWEPIDTPNPEDMPPKSALTGSRFGS